MITLRRLGLALCMLSALPGCPKQVVTPPVVQAEPLPMDFALEDAILVEALGRLGPMEGEGAQMPAREATLVGRSPEGVLRVYVDTRNVMDDAVYATRHDWLGKFEGGRFTITNELGVAYQCRRGEAQRESYGPALCP